MIEKKAQKIEHECPMKNEDCVRHNINNNIKFSSSD